MIIADNRNQSSSLSVIIPAYNESAGIGDTLLELIKHPRVQNIEILVIDDGSQDDTATIASQVTGVKVISHRHNRGYGSAIVTGIRQSTGNYIIWYDADGQHRPEDMLRIYDEMLSDDLDYCIGIRDKKSDSVRGRRAGKLILQAVVNIAANRRVRDFNSGLRGFRRDVITPHLSLFPKGFSASTTTTLLMLERGYHGSEVDITTRERIGKSSVKQLRDGTNTLAIILRIMLLFKPFVFFGTAGFICIVVGLVYGLLKTINEGAGFPVFGALLIIFGVQILFFGLLADQIAQMRQARLF